MSVLEESTPLILVVDDESTTRLMIEGVLQEHGFRVVTANDGDEAYKLFCKLQPAGVILDLEMPIMGGLAVCKEIRMHPELGHTPVMISTSNGDLNSIDDAFNAGATDFITKPHNLALLPRRIRYLLKSSLAMDKLRESATLKNEFMHNISHELRTPLNGVIGMVDLLGSTNLSAEQQDYCDTLKASSQVLLHIIGDTLDYSKLQAGGIHYEHRDFSLDELVQGSLDMVLFTIQEKGLQLNIRLEKDMPAQVMGDFLRLKQVLANLLSNAAKFTPAGSIELKVSVPKAGFIEFKVTDTGVGVPPVARDQIFEPFQQADGTTTRKYGGTGLGLTIARSMMREMGGDLALRGSSSNGSCFVGALPLSTVTGPDFYRRVPVLRILFLDDDPTIRQNVTGILSHLADVIDIVDIENSSLQQPDLVIYTSEAQTQIVEPLWQNAQVRFLHLKPASGAPSNPAIRNSHSMIWPFLRHKAIKLFDAPSTGQLVDSETPYETDLKILVAEDNLVNQKIISKMLSQLGLSCDVVGDGGVAVDEVKKTAFDLILMDCAMPILDGYSATRQIRSFEKASSRPNAVIVALTANAMTEDITRCLDSGMTAHLSKPCSQAKLKEMLSTHFSIDD